MDANQVWRRKSLGEGLHTKDSTQKIQSAVVLQNESLLNIKLTVRRGWRWEMYNDHWLCVINILSL